MSTVDISDSWSMNNDLITWPKEISHVLHIQLLTFHNCTKMIWFTQYVLDIFVYQHFMNIKYPL